MKFSVTEPREVLVDQDGLEFSLEEPEGFLDGAQAAGREGDRSEP